MLLGQPSGCTHIAARGRTERTVVFIEQTVGADITALETFSWTVRVGTESAAIVLHKLGSWVPTLLLYETCVDGGLGVFAIGRGLWIRDSVWRATTIRRA
jgi:hypothetical protein